MAVMGIAPTITTTRPDNPVLDGIISGLANSDNDFIADRISQRISAYRGASMEVGGKLKYSGVLQRFADAAWFGRPANRGAVAWGTEAHHLAGVRLDPLTWTARKYFYDLELPRELLASLSDISGGFDAAKALFEMKPIVEAYMMDREATYANLFFTAGNWLAANNTAIPAGQEWDTAGGQPTRVITNTIRTILLNGGRVDGCILGADTAYALTDSAAFNQWRAESEDRTNMPLPTVEAVLKARFGFKDVFVGMARANTSDAEGAGTLTNGFQWNDSMFIGKFGGAGEAMTDGSDVSARSMCAVSVIPEDLRYEERYEGSTQSWVSAVSMHEALSVVHNRLGGLITNCVA